MIDPPRLTAPVLSQQPGVRHGFFRREGGVSTGIYTSLNAAPQSEDEAEHVDENRRRIALALGSDTLLSTHQVHGADVVKVEAPWDTSARPYADGMVTNQPGLGLCILTADCVPVLFADIRLSIIGAAHAGWKGALGGICEATIEAMAAYGSRPRDLIAAIGPAIQQESYEVGPDFMDRFLADDPDNRTFFRPGTGDRQHFDLPGYVYRRLARARIGKIETLPVDTCANADWFSNRRRTHAGEPDYGRNAAVISLTRR